VTFLRLQGLKPLAWRSLEEVGAPVPIQPSQGLREMSPGRNGRAFVWARLLLRRFQMGQRLFGVSGRGFGVLFLAFRN
jgi:hypothetical protein